MESNQAGDQLRAIERAEASPYVDYHPSPWWAIPGFALWAAAMVAVQAITVVLSFARIAPWWLSALVAFGLALVLMSWYERYYARAAAAVRRRLA